MATEKQEKKNKRGHHEGTICQLADGRYQGRIMIGLNPETKKPVRKAVYGKSSKEVRDKLKAIREQMENGKKVTKMTKLTYSQWLDEFLAKDVKPSVRLTTYENYKGIIEKHIKPALGAKLLRDLIAEDFHELKRIKLEGDADGRGKKSPNTVRLIYLICKMSMRQAKQRGHVPDNVLNDVAAPRKPRKEIHPLPETDVFKLFRNIRNERLFPAFYLLVKTGMRRGELLGLKWEDIELEAGRLYIKRSLVKTNAKGVQFSEPKTARSRRMIPLNVEVVKVLREHRTRQDEEKQKLGENYQDSGMVFCREDGVPIYPDVLNGYFNRYLAKAGLPHYRVHDLRHTFATLMLKEDVHAKIVQDILGHASISTTLDIYSHVVPGLKEQAMGRLRSFLPEDASAEIKTPPVVNETRRLYRVA